MAARMPSNNASFNNGFSIRTAPAAAVCARTATLGSRRDQDRRKLDLAAAQLRQEVEAVHTWEPVVDHQAAGLRNVRVVQQIRSARVGSDQKSLDLKAELQRAAHCRIVIDDQHGPAGRCNVGMADHALEPRASLCRRKRHQDRRSAVVALTYLKFRRRGRGSVSSSRVQHARQQRHSNEFGQAASVHLRHDMGAVDFDSSRADTQIECNNLVGFSGD